MKFKVTSVALEPKTWERVAERSETVDTVTNPIFVRCVNGRAVGEMYEFYWNKLVDDPHVFVRVTNVVKL